MHTIVFRFRAALLAHQPERRKIHDVPSTNDSRDVVVVLASATRHAYVLYSRTSLNDTASAEMARRQLRDHIEGARREGGSRGEREGRRGRGGRGARGATAEYARTDVDLANRGGGRAWRTIEDEAAALEPRAHMPRPTSTTAHSAIVSLHHSANTTAAPTRRRRTMARRRARCDAAWHACHPATTFRLIGHRPRPRARPGPLVAAVVQRAAAARARVHAARPVLQEALAPRDDVREQLMIDRAGHARAPTDHAEEHSLDRSSRNIHTHRQIEQNHSRAPTDRAEPFTRTDRSSRTFARTGLTCEHLLTTRCRCGAPTGTRVGAAWTTGKGRRAAGRKEGAGRADRDHAARDTRRTKDGPPGNADAATPNRTRPDTARGPPCRPRRAA